MPDVSSRESDEQHVQQAPTVSCAYVARAGARTLGNRAPQLISAERIHLGLPGPGRGCTDRRRLRDKDHSEAHDQRNAHRSVTAERNTNRRAGILRPRPTLHAPEFPRIGITGSLVSEKTS